MIEQLDGMRETVRFEDQGSVRIYHNVEKEGYPLHWHNACEVIMPLQGGYRVVCQNQDIVLKQGDILWIGAGVLHQIYEPEEAEGERLLILYDPRFFNEFHEFSAVAVFSAPAVFIQKDVLPDLHQRLQDILLDVLQIEIDRGYFKNVMIYADMMKFNALIFSDLIQHQASLSKVALKQSNPDRPVWDANHMSQIYSSCKYIREHVADNLSLDLVAEQSGFSKFYFSRLFKTYTQMSFLEFLNRCRVSEAEKLLADPGRTVTAVALECGLIACQRLTGSLHKSKTVRRPNIKESRIA
ncbi:MAG: helix-turn-helix domain-containing protein, partial [Oscillospiraceae bacterium]|nr:helix-turn-helix domain-containing protein [Oscillospiraceae bacterium]